MSVLKYAIFHKKGVIVNRYLMIFIIISSNILSQVIHASKPQKSLTHEDLANLQCSLNDTYVAIRKMLQKEQQRLKSNEVISTFSYPPECIAQPLINIPTPKSKKPADQVPSNAVGQSICPRTISRSWSWNGWDTVPDPEEWDTADRPVIVAYTAQAFRK